VGSNPTLSAMLSMEPIFFATQADWRRWLERNHEMASEVVVGFYKKGSGRATLTWPQAVDEALCFGWIDGVRRRLDDESYTNRFTPRRRRSVWSRVNIARFKELDRLGLVRPPGAKAFAARDEARSGIYSYEQKPELPPEYEQQLRAKGKAWEFFQAQTPSYQRAAWRWIQSASREETRRKRLGELIQHSERSRRVPAVTGRAANRA
jgi:uncharacterized protein YdeI (YjbR/CyaY-like superfamily)